MLPAGWYREPSLYQRLPHARREEHAVPATAMQGEQSRTDLVGDYPEVLKATITHASRAADVPAEGRD
jgi:hypothetical protein